MVEDLLQRVALDDLDDLDRLRQPLIPSQPQAAREEEENPIHIMCACGWHTVVGSHLASLTVRCPKCGITHKLFIASRRCSNPGCAGELQEIAADGKRGTVCRSCGETRGLL